MVWIMDNLVDEILFLDKVVSLKCGENFLRHFQNLLNKLDIEINTI